jgi:hypothetical protein
MKTRKNNKRRGRTRKIGGEIQFKNDTIVIDKADISIPVNDKSFTSRFTKHGSNSEQYECIIKYPTYPNPTLRTLIKNFIKSKITKNPILEEQIEDVIEGLKKAQKAANHAKILEEYYKFINKYNTIIDPSMSDKPMSDTAMSDPSMSDKPMSDKPMSDKPMSHKPMITKVQDMSSIHNTNNRGYLNTNDIDYIQPLDDFYRMYENKKDKNIKNMNTPIDFQKYEKLTKYNKSKYKTNNNITYVRNKVYPNYSGVKLYYISHEGLTYIKEFLQYMILHHKKIPDTIRKIFERGNGLYSPNTGNGMLVLLNKEDVKYIYKIINTKMDKEIPTFNGWNFIYNKKRT